ncbi:MAG: serine/threonine dehydratase [Rickettsiaceae bacterium]
MNSLEQKQEVMRLAYLRIKQYIHKTPILQSNLLNNMFGNKIYFKMEALQKTGSFKIRGVLNHLLALKERGELPQKIVAYSTGNHGLAMAYAAKLFKIKARIYLPQNISPIKMNIAKFYGADVISVKTRQQAEDLAQYDGIKNYHYLAPSDDNYTIAGAGTACYEALQELAAMNATPDVIFAPCGGGGLLSGSYLAKELLSPSTKLHGVEPQNANDAYRSLHSDEIFRFFDSPNTIADGLTALSVSDRTMHYLRKLDKFHLVEEEAIHYWTGWLMQIMKITCEPSAAISLEAVKNWSHETKKNQSILVIITGGNVDHHLFK